MGIFSSDQKYICVFLAVLSATVVLDDDDGDGSGSNLQTFPAIVAWILRTKEPLYRSILLRTMVLAQLLLDPGLILRVLLLVRKKKTSLAGSKLLSSRKWIQTNTSSLQKKRCKKIIGLTYSEVQFRPPKYVYLYVFDI